MPLRARAGLLAAVLITVAAAVAMSTASAADPWTGARPVPSPLGGLGAGFAPTATPAPESTIHPSPQSWSSLRAAPGYRVILLTTGGDEPTLTLRTAVREWAAETGADLRTVVADGNLTGSADAAIRMHPDLIVIAGDDLIDPLAIVTANHLDQQFLVVGAELAEPTANVTAADWAGASFRGEGLGTSSTYDPRSFTPQRCGEAIRAGVAAVLSGYTGLVVWIDS
jgi:hypothetical protein